jgi:hypothetical protein
METIGMRNDHAEFNKILNAIKHQASGEMRFDKSILPIMFIHLERRIRELEFKINEK